jgi:undecaprenyl-diphosphatase
VSDNIIKFIKNCAVELMLMIAGITVFFGIYMYTLGGLRYSEINMWYYDLFFRNNGEALTSQGLTTFMSLITNVSSVYFYVSSFILFLLYMHKSNRQKRYAFALGISVNIAFFAGYILKVIFARERPDVERLAEASGYSFPSLHALTCTAFFGLLIFIIWNMDFSRIIKVLVTIFSVFIIAVVSFSRVYLGVHYESDVIAGISLGIAIAAFVSFGLKVLRSLITYFQSVFYNDVV